MKNEQGFSLVELLIVVAIIAIIAAIAVPSLLSSRMAANEVAGIQGCRTAGSAEIAFAATNNQMYTNLATLIAQNFLDGRFTNGINGYTYADAQVNVTGGAVASFPAAVAGGSADFGITASPQGTMGRFVFGVGTDQVVRYQSAVNGATLPVAAGTGVGAMAGGS